MIYGNPITLGGGGGGGLKDTDAVLLATVPTGATVTMTKGGVSLTPTMWGKAADSTLDCAIFSIPSSQFDSSPWTVTATKGQSSDSKTVVVDAADVYQLKVLVLVPSAYQAVEYIQMISVSALDTGYSPDTDTVVRVKLMNITSTGNIILGFNPNDNEDWRLFNNNQQLYFDTPTNQRIYGDHLYQNSIYEFELGNFYVKNVGSSTNILTGTAHSFASTYKIGMYSNNRWYYLKIFNGSTLVRDYVPCYRKSDSVAGMWDRANETFLVNTGSGTITVGPDVNY